jgi:hypothetical protein
LFVPDDLDQLFLKIWLFVVEDEETAVKEVIVKGAESSVGMKFDIGRHHGTLKRSINRFVLFDHYQTKTVPMPLKNR